VQSELKRYRAAGYPAIAIETYEEQRIIAAALAAWPDRAIMTIAAAGGLMDARSGKSIDPQATYPKAIAGAAGKDGTVLVMLDYQHIVANAAAYRPLLAALPQLKMRRSMLILVAPHWALPEELRHELPLLQSPLPGPDELRGALGVVTEATGTVLESEHETRLLSAARGLTIAEAENAYALAAFDSLSPAKVEAEKMRLVRSGCMSVEQPAPPESLAGLGRLKEYIRAEVIPAAADDLLRVRGVLLVGVPGTGKSLSAKVLASLLDWPLVRLDISAAKGSLVGQSEANLRHALATADAVAPCVLWLDEVEKAIGGYASSAQSDAGTTLGMVGSLLTWMQEHTSPVLVVATCNDYAKLPPELTRAGRFDERFFLDLPAPQERAAIARVHLSRLGCDHDGLPGAVSEMTADWTGAEIEQLIRSAARRTGRRITRAALETAAGQIIPISRHANIQALRDWARDHLRPANDEEVEVVGVRRKIGVA